MKNKSRRALITFITIGSIFLFIGFAFAQEFSADITSTTKAGTMTGKISVSKQKSRLEFPDIITITRLDKNVVWMLMPGQNMYMEHKLSPQDVIVATDKIPGEIERTLIGGETINGQKTNKYRIVYIVDNITTAIFQWISADSGIPIKTEAQDASWIFEFENLKIGQQPDSLFEIPQGYKKFSYDIPSLPEAEVDEDEYRFQTR